MKKFIIVLMLLCTAVFAQSEPKISIYVMGGIRANEKKALSNEMLSSFINSGKFKTVEREDAFQAQVQGQTDINQISELGKQFGLSHICIVDIAPVLDSYQASARIIDVETAAVKNRGDADGQFKTTNDIRELSNKLIENMFKNAEAEKHLEALSSQTISVYKDIRGTILSMSDILFETGKASLTSEFKENLAEIAAILKSYFAESNVIVEGHTDNVGSEQTNRSLSEQRANEVVNYLAGRGIEKQRLSAIGYGFSRPVADNDTPEGRTKNRRVEFIITAPRQQQQPVYIPLQPVAPPVEEQQ